MSSSTRLSKLSQYLYDGNYQQAVELYDRKLQQPHNQQEYLLLAKAYYVGQHYSNVLDILKKISNPIGIKVHFQVIILKIKARYLNQSVKQKDMDQLQWIMKKYSSYFNQYHQWCLQQIKSIVQRQLSVKRSNFASKQILKDQKQQFMQIYNKYNDFSPIMQGMPIYLISQRWYQQWQQYVSFQSKVSGQNPGPITNFQIIDHVYNGYFDSRKQKYYTNNYLFQPCKYKLMPKQCWDFLYSKYGGIEVVRYNISDINKPNEIITEVYLKKIALVQKNKIQSAKVPINTQQICTYVQITKKQNWKGLIQNKLQKKWGQNGTIVEFLQNETRKIDLNQFLQDCDTIGKLYVYIPNSKDDKITQNGQKCGNKSCSKKESLKYCQCKSIRYCGLSCLKQDRDKHRKKCDLQISHIKQKSAIIQNFNLSQKQYSGRKGLVGLRNLGNTCYMNSGLQCMSNTKQITDYFMSNGFLKDINHSNPLGTKGHLACAYAELMREMWAGRDDVVSPFNLKKMIGKFATQFSGFGQQDSQQFISYLIDGLQQDLNLIKKKQTFQTKDDILPDQQASLQSQRNYSKRIQSYIRDLMAGQFKSTVRCLTCKKISICFDPYLLLSLPIPTPKVGQVYLVNTDLSHGAIKLNFEMTDSTSIKQLDTEIRRQYKELNKLIYLKMDKEVFEITRIIQNINDPILFQHRESQLLFAYQIPENQNNFDIYFTQFYFQKERNGFPRFLKFPKKNFDKYYQKIIQQSYQRASKKSYEDVIESAKKMNPSQIYNRVCDKYLLVQFKRNTKLLTFKENKNFQFTKTESRNINLNDCLSSFSKTELLQKQNQWYCNKCKKFMPAQKQLQIYKSNKILVLAFKRFSRFKKIKTPIQFPIQGFDMGPFLRSNKQKRPIMYDLYGVVNHYGSLAGGHYTSYCQNFINKKWYEFNDSHVSQINRRQIASQNSYVLFFRRRN